MKKILSFLITIIITAGCKEKYNPPVTSPQTGYLVVEGFINNGAEPTTILLSRATQLEQGIGTVYETGAQVTIEGNNGETYPLYQSSEGVYYSQSLSLNATISYRLHISTSDGREYTSDYTPVKSTPPIDSISWRRDNGDVQIIANTHDPLNETKYYQWQYVETWEYHSTYQSVLTYIRDPLTGLVSSLDYWYPNHSPNLSIYACWHTGASSGIVLGTTEKLTTDVIHYPIQRIEQKDQKLSVLYRIAVKQTALSKTKYQFLQRMKKNTETLGSIFDAQPSQLNTNLHCLSNPAEQVIGFIEVSQQRDDTLFIRNSEVPDWNYRTNCSLNEILNNVDTINEKASAQYPVAPAKLAPDGVSIKTFYSSDGTCVDCTLQGGTNIKPDFWPR